MILPDSSASSASCLTLSSNTIWLVIELDSFKKFLHLIFYSQADCYRTNFEEGTKITNQERRIREEWKNQWTECTQWPCIWHGLRWSWWIFAPCLSRSVGGRNFLVYILHSILFHKMLLLCFDNEEFDCHAFIVWKISLLINDILMTVKISYI